MDEKLRILVIDEYFPYPANSGKPIRTWNLLRRLAQKHDVTLLCYGLEADAREALSQCPRLNAAFVPSLKTVTTFQLYVDLVRNLFSSNPYSVVKHSTARFKKKMHQLLADGRFDLIHCEWTPYAAFLDRAMGVPTYIATHNVESQILFRRAEQGRSILEKLFFLLQARRMKKFETEVLLQANGVGAVTDQDALQFVDWGVRHVDVIQNGVDLDFYIPGVAAEAEGEVLFLASLDWQPNVDALKFFLHEIWPLIVKREPFARVKIAGRRPSSHLQKVVEKCPNATLLGEVKDVRPVLASAAAVVVPLRIGGGSRLKILEALAMKKAVVSTSVGAEGLDLKVGDNILIADSPPDFAESVLKVLSSAELRKSLGSAGSRAVKESYSWDYSAVKLEMAWMRVLRSSRNSTDAPAQSMVPVQ